MLLLTSSQSQELDNRSTIEFPLTQQQLMEAAAKAVLRNIRKLFARKRTPKRILLLVGPGKNGEDAKLIQKFWSDKKAVFTRVEPTADKNIDASNIPLSVDLIIDGFFGTGLNRDLKSPYKEILEHLAPSKAKRVAIDIPSGLDADTGVIRGATLRADLTVTFGASKPGLHQYQGPSKVGQLVVEPLLFPRALIKEIAKDQRAFGASAARRCLPPRPLTAHKASSGHVYLFAGSEKYRGAGILAARAALSAGAGYVHLIGDNKVYPEILQLPEVIYENLENFDFTKINKDQDIVVLGPGFSDASESRQILRELLKAELEKVLLDAEAFHLLDQGKFEGKTLPKSWLLTPHPGELGRLLGVKATDINLDRPGFARKAQRSLAAVVLLKGFRTLIADEKLCTVILSGNSALGKAGSGDVLAGFIAGLWSQNMKTREAALLGAYLHGYVATKYVREGNDPATLIPSRIIELLPKIMSEFRKKKNR